MSGPSKSNARGLRFVACDPIYGQDPFDSGFSRLSTQKHFIDGVRRTLGKILGGVKPLYDIGKEEIVGLRHLPDLISSGALSNLSGLRPNIPIRLSDYVVVSRAFLSEPESNMGGFIRLDSDTNFIVPKTMQNAKGMLLFHDGLDVLSESWLSIQMGYLGSSPPSVAPWPVSVGGDTQELGPTHPLYIPGVRVEVLKPSAFPLTSTGYFGSLVFTLESRKLFIGFNWEEMAYVLAIAASPGGPEPDAGVAVARVAF